MISIGISDKDFRYLCGVKFNSINQRVKNRRSYQVKNIRNRFSFTDFIDFARANGLAKGKHCHRPDPNGDYEPENLVFISEEEHRRITGLERRKLSAAQISEILELSTHMSLRKIAKRYGVSHVTIHRYLKRKNIEHHHN